jgi:hypothetical protein
LRPFVYSFYVLKFLAFALLRFLPFCCCLFAAAFFAAALLLFFLMLLLRVLINRAGVLAEFHRQK